jgi:hypothetical protein
MKKSPTIEISVLFLLIYSWSTEVSPSKCGFDLILPKYKQWYIRNLMVATVPIQENSPHAGIFH